MTTTDEKKVRKKSGAVINLLVLPVRKVRKQIEVEKRKTGLRE